MTALDPLPEINSSPLPPLRSRRVALTATLVFSSLWLAAAAASAGFGPADGCMHFLFARFALRDPHNFVDMWARPLCTLLYAFPAAIGGRMGACTMSWLVALGCACVAWRVAQGQKLRLPVLAFIFTLCQPLLFLHTLTAMTELPFALVLGAAFLAFQSRRGLLAALLISLTPLGRPEGFGFLLLGAIAFTLARQWAAVAILPIGLILWDLAGWVIGRCEGSWWKWLPGHWPYAGTSMYGHGNPLTFVAVLPVVVSPLVLPAMLVGIQQSLKRSTTPGRDSSASHLARCRALTALIPLFVLLVHSYLYAAGKMASDGEARYLLVVAPFWGVLAARGWEWLTDQFHVRFPLRWAAFAALTPIIANVARPVVPLRPPPDWYVARRFAEWYRSGEVQWRYPKIGASHPAVFYHLDRSPTDGRGIVEWKRESLLFPEPGTLLVWDPICGNKNASPDRAVDVKDLVQAGWVENEGADAFLNAPPVERAGEEVGAPGPWHVLMFPEADVRNSSQKRGGR